MLVPPGHKCSGNSKLERDWAGCGRPRTGYIIHREDWSISGCIACQGSIAWEYSIVWIRNSPWEHGTASPKIGEQQHGNKQGVGNLAKAHQWMQRILGKNYGPLEKTNNTHTHTQRIKPLESGKKRKAYEKLNKSTIVTSTPPQSWTQKQWMLSTIIFNTAEKMILQACGWSQTEKLLHKTES